MLVSKSLIVTHRSARTAVDGAVGSADIPSAWGDAPAALTVMASKQILRIYPSYTGTITKFAIQILVRIGSTIYVGAEFVVSADFKETIDFVEGFEGEDEIWIKISQLEGTSPVLTLSICGINK